jgi:archaellum biogenesis protein FlaJ (TadC family)
MFRGVLAVFKAFNHFGSEREISLAGNTYGCHLRLGADDLVLGAAISNSKLDMQNMRLRRG